jgi:hypothetical protein
MTQLPVPMLSCISILAHYNLSGATFARCRAMYFDSDQLQTSILLVFIASATGERRQRAH